MTAPTAPPTQPTVEEVVRELGSVWSDCVAYNKPHVALAIDRAITLLQSLAKDARLGVAVQALRDIGDITPATVNEMAATAATDVQWLALSNIRRANNALMEIGPVDTAIDLARGADNE